MKIKHLQLHILNLVRQEKIRDIYDCIEKKSSIRLRESIRIVETLFKQRARNNLIAIRNQFYDRKEKLDDLGISLFMYIYMYIRNVLIIKIF